MEAPAESSGTSRLKSVTIEEQMVAIAKGIHLLPFRTEKLSPFTPMVLPQGGRVGSRLPKQRPVVKTAGLFYYAN